MVFINYLLDVLLLFNYNRACQIFLKSSSYLPLQSLLVNGTEFHFWKY